MCIEYNTIKQFVVNGKMEQLNQIIEILETKKQKNIDYENAEDIATYYNQLEEKNNLETFLLNNVSIYSSYENLKEDYPEIYERMLQELSEGTMSLDDIRELTCIELEDKNSIIILTYI